MGEALYVLGPDLKPVPDPKLLGPLLFAALRKFSQEHGRQLARTWWAEARHTLLYVSQDAASLRTSLEREDFTNVQLAVELQELISQLTGLRDAILPASAVAEAEVHGYMVRDKAAQAPAHPAAAEPGPVDPARVGPAGEDLPAGQAQRD